MSHDWVSLGLGSRPEWEATTTTPENRPSVKAGWAGTRTHPARIPPPASLPSESSHLKIKNGLASFPQAAMAAFSKWNLGQGGSCLMGPSPQVIHPLGLERACLQRLFKPSLVPPKLKPWWAPTCPCQPSSLPPPTLLAQTLQKKGGWRCRSSFPALNDGRE